MAPAAWADAHARGVGFQLFPAFIAGFYRVEDIRLQLLLGEILVTQWFSRPGHVTSTRCIGRSTGRRRTAPRAGLS